MSKNNISICLNQFFEIQLNSKQETQHAWQVFINSIYLDAINEYQA